MRADVDEVACALVGGRVAECLFHDLLLLDLEGAMIVVLPPALPDSIVNVRVVVPILRQAIVNQDRVQLVRPLLVLDVW